MFLRSSIAFSNIGRRMQFFVHNARSMSRRVRQIEVLVRRELSRKRGSPDSIRRYLTIYDVEALLTSINSMIAELPNDADRLVYTLALREALVSSLASLQEELELRFKELGISPIGVELPILRDHIKSFIVDRTLKGRF